MMDSDIDAWLDELDKMADDDNEDSIFDVADDAQGDAVEVIPDGCYVIAWRGGRYFRIRKVDDEWES